MYEIASVYITNSESATPLYPNAPDGDFLQVSGWQVINTNTPELDQSLPVVMG